MNPKIPVAASWAIHAFTASGAVLAFFAFLSVEQDQFRLALLWLAAALVVDGVDGPMARKLKVKERVPDMDGATLDLVVDYLTYVFVPALLIYRSGLSLYGLVAVAAILLSSLYTFARTDMKTEDNFFRGFPAVWNVIAFYLYLLQPGPVVGAVVIALFAVLTFAPIHFIHPVRVKRYQPWLGALTAIWGVSSTALLWPAWNETMLKGLEYTSVTTAAALLAIGLIRTVRGAR